VKGGALIEVSHAPAGARSPRARTSTPAPAPHDLLPTTITGMSNDQSVHKVELFRLLGRFWTLANMLSMIRLLLVVPIAYLILTDGPLGWLFSLILLALMTDWFDGRVARWSGTVSEWGKVLDPLADKAAGAAIVMALVVRGSLPVWFLSVLVLRDALIVLGGVVLARRTGQVVMSAWMGKVAVTALSVTVLAALMRADVPVLLYCVWITTALMGYSFVLYALRFVRLMKAGTLPESPAPPSGEGFVRQETESTGTSR